MANEGWSVDLLKQHIDQQLEQRDRLLNERLRFQDEAAKATAISLEARLHALNNFRDSLADAAARNVTREEFDNSNQNLGEKLEIAARPKWNMLGIGTTILLASVTGMWALINSQISGAIGPLGISMTELKESSLSREKSLGELSDRLRLTEAQSNRSAIADENSRVDRSQANLMLRDIETHQSELAAISRAAGADTKAKLVEIETQFKSISTAHAVYVDTVEQWLAMLYEAVFHKPFPRSTFRPTFHREAN